ncbi:MAG: glycosyltransferase family 4 protein [Phycisphaerales bacterium]|nr:glycosyltransferase family 4 protein [Phycisphaerales bacterium]
MRITIINQFYAPDISPTAHLAASLAEGLAEHGHQMTIIASRGGYVEASQVEQSAGDNPRVHRIWTPRLGKKTIIKRCIDYASFYLGAAYRMTRLAPQDVIISLTTPPYIAWTSILHRALHPRTKLVLWNMDCYPEATERAGIFKTGGLVSRSMRWLNRQLFGRLDHLICLDHAMADLLLDQYCRPHRTLATTVIPNWEKAAYFAPSATDLSPWPPMEQPPLAGKFIVLYLGNAGFGHRFDTIIQAARRLRDREVVFLFVGGGKAWDGLKEIRQREGLENFVLHGYVQQKQDTIRIMAAAGCALISLREDMAGVMSPSKMHANLAMGLPILYVGPAGSNVDEAIVRFGCGLSVREGDVDAVVGFIESAMADPASFGAMKIAARKAFETAYCDEKTLPMFERVISGLFEPQTGVHAHQR